MPDITLCTNKSCSKRKRCYRFMAKPDKYQSFALFKPDNDGKCEEFKPLERFNDSYVEEFFRILTWARSMPPSRLTAENIEKDKQ